MSDHESAVRAYEAGDSIPGDEHMRRWIASLPTFDVPQRLHETAGELADRLAAGAGTVADIAMLSFIARFEADPDLDDLIDPALETARRALEDHGVDCPKSRRRQREEWRAALPEDRRVVYDAQTLLQEMPGAPAAERRSIERRLGALLERARALGSLSKKLERVLDALPRDDG